jgi:hypothetical protein
MPASITFETKCWQNDWEFLLKTDRITTMIERNNYGFDVRRLCINNVTDHALVCEHAQRLVDRGVLTEYCSVQDYADEALEFFNLSRASLGAGYVYSIAELVSIYLCRTDYLLHFSGDSMPAASINWIDAALQRFEQNDRTRVANLTWNRRYDEARKESFAEDDDFYVGYGFSDQMYLVRTVDFQAPIYNETHPLSTRYPHYGGELFEKRVDSWMRNHELHRITFKHGSYIHANFPTNTLTKKLYLFLGKHAQ